MSYDQPSECQSFTPVQLRQEQPFSGFCKICGKRMEEHSYIFGNLEKAPREVDLEACGRIVERFNAGLVPPAPYVAA